jgi:hypothetical protein
MQGIFSIIVKMRCKGQASTTTTVAVDKLLLGYFLNIYWLPMVTERFTVVATDQVKMSNQKLEEQVSATK